MGLKVIEFRCPKNHKCPAVMVCPVDALTQSGVGAPEVDNDKCINCGKCTYFCPTGALVLE